MKNGQVERCLSQFGSPAGKSIPMEDEWALKFGIKLSEKPFAAGEDPIEISTGCRPVICAAGDGPGREGKLTIDLYSRMLPSLKAYLAAHGLSREHSEDVIQEAFLRLVRKNAQLGMDDNWKAWVFRVAHNLAMDHHRSQKRRQLRNEIGVHRVQHERVDPSPDPEQKILNKERVRKLQLAFSQSTPRQRDCLRLRSKGLRYREIALTLGVSVQRVGELMQRAISRVNPEAWATQGMPDNRADRGARDVR